MLAHAQSTDPQTKAGTIISGSDIGFRVEKNTGTAPVGTLMVRINGQWVEAQFGVGVKRLTTR